MKTWIKGGIIGLAIWILFLLIFKISGALIDQTLPDNIDEMLIGTSHWNSIQNFTLIALSILSFPFIFLGGNPNLGTVGPGGVMLFWIGSAISLTLWGMLFGWIIKKIKSNKK